jgi:hypothetical protein
MKFNYHGNLEGRHAYLSPSQYHWINYDDDKLLEHFSNREAARRGSQLHALAADLIKLKVTLPQTSATLNSYVNHVIRYRMSPEVMLQVPGSDVCFGTADAIGFKKNVLRIFDLKTGVSPASVKQLLVYAAIFCLEYDFKAFDIEYDLRIYQSDEIKRFDVDPVDVAQIIAKINHFEKILANAKEELED